MSRHYIEPLVQKSTPSIIADKLREAIGHGELPPGSQLLEAQLARELGVSRGPLREGMQRLTQEGLLISVRNRGLFVLEMTPENVEDMYVARSAIERAAAARVVRGDRAAAAEELLAVVDRMGRAAARNREAAVGEADIEFHRLLVELSESPRLRRVHETLITETRMCIHALAESYRASERRVEEHRAIAEAIGSGDRRLVDRLLVEHMDDAVRRLTGDTRTPTVAADAAETTPA
ncbi:MAG TPA: GntR family transcriptional regulator [Segeticoccus sp.]|uniref:GntR family transcriptional regulator n=1 Tax=Segeticoccus sp. TaxID=2706531 RepID=UPI002D7F24EC|nr:GntR family transcriptional regulator [Segeticoccus sp.]HET8602230.1 GntR family transcriptional regulator [Segeticoccus sp.]